MARAGQRHLGGARPPAAPCLLEGHVLGDARPRGAPRRPIRQARRPGLGTVARADRGRGAGPRLELRAGLLHHRLRRHRPRCATLHIGLSGLLAPDDERFQATVTALEAELRSGSTVYRYNRDDALPGGEGGFHLCASWLVEAYLGCRRRTEAEELFQQIVDAAGPTGLLPEEYDPIAERSFGNHPQAYSHLGLIRCAMLMDARGRLAPPSLVP